MDRSPDAPPQRVLALNQAIGNAALSRTLGQARLQRLKKEHEAPHLRLGYAIEDAEHFRALLLPTQVRWNEYHYQEFLQVRVRDEVDPLIERLKALRADIEAEKDPDAKLKEAATLLKQLLTLLKELNDGGQDEDAKAVKAEYDKGNAARKARLEKELSSRAAASVAEEQLKKAQADALAVQSTISATGVTPSDVGPAFARPGATGRDKLHTWITLSWKPFRNLPRDSLDNAKCFVYHLSKAQLETLIVRLGDQTVTTYAFQGWPSTRPALVGGVDGLVVPVQLGGMSGRFGAEILIDWIVPNPGHTAPASNLVDSFRFTEDEAKFTEYGGTVTRTPGRIRYDYNTGRRLIVNEARDAVITYYHGGG